MNALGLRQDRSGDVKAWRQDLALTVKYVLVEAGLGPEPHDHPDTWPEFLKRHAETMWQCDFACKWKWTVRGMVDGEVLQPVR